MALAQEWQHGETRAVHFSNTTEEEGLADQSGAVSPTKGGSGSSNTKKSKGKGSEGKGKGKAIKAKLGMRIDKS